MNNKEITGLLNKEHEKEWLKEVPDLPLIIVLESGIIYSHCFIEEETTNYISIQNTEKDGSEKFKIINKEWIESIGIVYADDEQEPKKDMENLRSYG